MPDEYLVFEQTMEALFLRALEGRLSPRCKERMRQAGLNLDAKLQPAYPFSVWMQCLQIAAEEVFAGEPLERGAFKLGESYVAGFRETMLGRAVLSLLKVLGPKRALQRATQNFRAGNNYTESRLTEIGPALFELWMNEVGHLPSFTAGILHGGLKAAGAVDIRIDISGHDGHACTYRISWKEASVSSGVAGRGDSKAATRSGSISSL